jgi:hypothetical protein
MIRFRPSSTARDGSFLYVLCSNSRIGWRQIIRARAAALVSSPETRSCLQELEAEKHVKRLSSAVQHKKLGSGLLA